MILEQRIIESWAESGDGGRLTRAARAEITGVSIATLEKVINRAGNDKAVLVGIFSSVALTWSDSFCEPAEEALNVQLSGETADGEELGNRLPRRRGVPWWQVVSIIVIPVALGATWITNQSAREQVHLESKAYQVIEAGRNHYHEANYAEAILRAEEALFIAKKSRSLDAAANAEQILGQCESALGHLTEASSHFRSSATMWRSIGEKQGEGIALELLAVNEARLGNLEIAETHFRESRKLFLELNNGRESPGPLRGIGSVYAVRGDYSTARKWYAEALAALDRTKDEATFVDIRALQALLLRDEKKYADALRELAACLEYWREKDHPRWVATTKLQIATVLLASKDTEGAYKELNEAISLYAKVGDSLGEDQCRQLKSGGRTARTEEFF